MPKITSSTKVISSKKTTQKNSNASNSKLSINNSPVSKFLYGEGTVKALNNFNIGEEKMPAQVIKAIGLLKKAATIANAELKLLSKDKALKIIRATDEIIDGKLNEHFPLTI